MVTEIAPRHQREVFSPHPDDPYLTVEIGLYYGLYPFFSLLKIQPSGTAFAPAKSYTFKR